MKFILISDPDNIRDGPIGPQGRELEFWIPNNTAWTQLNYGQGEGQVEINGCEWGLYFAAENELSIVLHQGSISVSDAVTFAEAIAAKILYTKQYQLIFRGHDT